jgi:hypothetical protein
MAVGLTGPEIAGVLDYVQVQGDYLGRGYGDWSHQKLQEFFWRSGLTIDTSTMVGSIKNKFLSVLRDAAPADQAQILRGLLDKYAIGPSYRDGDEQHTARETILVLAERLEGKTSTLPTRPTRITSDVVEEALQQADTLIAKHGPSAALDRVHTAFHGYLLAVCDQAAIAYPDKADITTLYKILRAQHPKLSMGAVRAQDVDRVLKTMASIVDVLNPLRNNSSMAHPNDDRLEAAEARLVIDATKTMLHYLDEKLRR